MNIIISGISNMDKLVHIYDFLNCSSNFTRVYMYLVRHQGEYIHSLINLCMCACAPVCIRMYAYVRVCTNFNATLCECTYNFPDLYITFVCSFFYITLLYYQSTLNVLVLRCNFHRADEHIYIYLEGQLS